MLWVHERNHSEIMCTPSKCKAMESKITPEITQNKQHAQPMQRLTTRTEKNEGFSENM